MSRAIVPILAVFTIFNLTVLGTCISATTTSNGPDSPSYEIVFITDAGRIRLVFIYITIPIAALLVSVYNLIRHRSLNARRVALSASFCASIYLVAVLLWGQCAYKLGGVHMLSGLAQDICYTPWPYTTRFGYRDSGRYLAPCFALVGAVVGVVISILAIIALRRQRKIARDETHQQSLIAGKERGSFESTEVSFDSLGAQTLPSRPRSTVPSRQLSSARQSTRPPTYYSNGDDSLLTVDEKDEQRGSVEYV